MLNIDNIYKLTQDRARKDLAGKYISPDQFNRACQKAVTDIYNEYVGSTKKYVHQKRSSPVTATATQKIRDVLIYFTQTVVLSPSLEGFLRYPADYEGYKDLEAIDAKICQDDVHRVVPKEAEVRLRSQDEKTSIINSRIFPPSYERIYAFAGGIGKGIQMIPKDAAKKYRLHYYRMITQPKWEFTLSETQKRPVYDDENSVDIDLPQSMVEDVLNRICAEVGIPLTDVDMVQYSMAEQKDKGV